jgi:hypothetical protein
LVGSEIDLSLDTVITLARNLFKVPIATVSLVGEEKQFFFGAQGLDGAGRFVLLPRYHRTGSVRRARRPPRRPLR